MSASAAISEIRTRLQNAGYSVTMFRSVDPEEESLPLAVVNFADEGEQWEESSPLDRVQAMISVVLFEEYAGDDYELTAVQKAEALRDLLVTRVPDIRDSLDGAVDKAFIDSMSIGVRQTDTNVIASLVKVRLEYTE